jgi:oligoribonuclease
MAGSMSSTTHQQTVTRSNDRKEDRLIWIDMEMSGLNPETDVVLEIATIVTDAELNVIETGPSLVVNQPASLFDKMDDWNKEHHTKSGLWKSVLESKVSCAEAERLTLEFVKKHTGHKKSPLCGNSVWQDRRFLVKYMPQLDDYLHYRLIDVSTIKELASRWYTDFQKFQKKESAHRALDDIQESIDELIYYRKNFFKPS